MCNKNQTMKYFKITINTEFLEAQLLFNKNVS